MFIGVDVGTASVRCGLIDRHGDLLAYDELPLVQNNYGEHYYEQCSEEIVDKSIKVIRSVIEKSRVPIESVHCITFDATCSLVVRSKVGKPFSVTDTTRCSKPKERPLGAEFDVMMWCDHRAMEEKRIIDESGHCVLRYLGGQVSVEHELPKVLWVKRHLPWGDVGVVYDLADYLTHAFSGTQARSVCTSVCKWGYVLTEDGPGEIPRDFTDAIGLPDLLEHVSGDVRRLGQTVGCINEDVAALCGVGNQTKIGVGIIDAHAGGVGCVVGNSPDRILALIGGTSSCHMACSRNPIFVPGVWGPYYSAMIDGYWLNEGGESATGSCIEYTVKTHPAYSDAERAASREGTSVFDWLNKQIGKEADPYFARHVHVLPYHHGNRSPHADPEARGMVDGLTLDRSLASLTRYYVATCEAIAYGTRDIIEAMERQGHHIDQINVCGSHSRNSLLLRLYADVTQKPVLRMHCSESMLLGCAVLGAVATGCFPSFDAAASAMNRVEETILPRLESAEYHRVKFEIFREMYQQQLKRRERMNRVTATG